MPTFDKKTADRTTMDGYEGYFGQLGDYPVEFGSFTADADLTPLFIGLPEARCQAQHWGVVLKGQLVLRYPDGEEVVGAGQAYLAKPGHTVVIAAATELIEFSPTAQLTETVAVVMANLHAAEARA
jgi:hypothetical protein